MQEKSSAFYTTLVFIHAETGPTVKHLQWQGLQPQGPQIPTDIRTCPPYALWLLWEQGPQGTASLPAADLDLFSLAQVLPLCGAALD